MEPGVVEHIRQHGHRFASHGHHHRRKGATAGQCRRLCFAGGIHSRCARAEHPQTTVIDQLDKEFVPRVSVLQTGTPVEFPNSDNIRHQVYSFSPAKTFTLKLYSGRPGEPVVFDKPGVVVLGCNIHDHMIAWVVAVDTPWFARTDAHGQAALRELPAGSYQLSVWHPAVAKPVASGRIDLGDGDQVERSIQLETGPLLGALDDPGTH